MSSTENVNFTKRTVYSLFSCPILSKTETYAEISSEGEPFKIIVNQDYFKKEFDIEQNKDNN